MTTAEITALEELSRTAWESSMSEIAAFGYATPWFDTEWFECDDVDKESVRECCTDSSLGVVTTFWESIRSER